MLKTNRQTRIISLVLCCLCLLSFGQDGHEQHNIEGTIKLDSTWTNKIYLSFIPSFNKMYTMSNSMIISVAKIDDNGYFYFDTSYLPEEEQLYRLHISKKNAPPASLIIGGKDENHKFLITSKNAKTTVSKSDIDSPFSQTSVKGNWPNNALAQINTISRFIDSTAVEDTYLKREFITTGINEKLRFIADTSSNALVSLYALYQSKYEANTELNAQFYQNYLNKWKHNRSTYFKEFRKSMPIKNENKSYLTIFIGLLCFGLGVALGYYFWVKRKTNKLKSLSIQERNIFNLLREGKTNKEISNELSIGLSTVKSHVSNIYTKLGIKSRKEILDLD